MACKECQIVIAIIDKHEAVGNPVLIKEAQHDNWVTGSQEGCSCTPIRLKTPLDQGGRAIWLAHEAMQLRPERDGIGKFLKILARTI